MHAVPGPFHRAGGLTGLIEVQAVLLVGFLREEFSQICSMMQSMEADMVKIIPCSRAMLQGSLQEAIESTPPPHEQVHR